MAPRLIDHETYDALVKAYSAAPGFVAGAAAAAGCSWTMAKRAWNVGWPAFEWAVPIRDVIEAEKARLRIQRAADVEVMDGRTPIAVAKVGRAEKPRRMLPQAARPLTDEERVLAADDVADVRRMERQLVTYQRRHALRAVVRREGAEAAIDALVARVAEVMESGALDLAEALDCLRVFALLDKVTDEQIAHVFDRERQLLGDPKAGRLGREWVGRPMEEILARLEQGVRDRMAVKDGAPRVVDGGEGTGET